MIGVMSNVTPMELPEEQPDQLSKPVALRKVREIAAISERVFFRNHARRRMKERDITTTHVFHCLKLGFVEHDPYLNENGNWEFNVIGRVAGTQIVVGVEIDWPQELIVITTF